MKHLSIDKLLIAIFCLNLSPVFSASIIPVCSENKSINNCSKNKLSFPLFAKDSSGKATFKYKIDQGALGELSSEEVVAFTTEALDLWSQESNISFEKIGDGLFETNVDSSNFRDYVDEEQGFNLIIWDDAGEILENLYGKSAKNNVLGYATPIAYNYKKNKIDSIKEAQTLLNGYLFDRNVIGGSKSGVENLFQTTVLHEFAHMFGLDHTQGGNLEGYNNSEGDYRDIPVMFPAAANPDVALHTDDISAIKLAYPKDEDATNLGSISGSLTKSSSPLEGANIVAYKLGESNPKLFAVASPADVDGLKKGNFLLPNLTPGDYVLYAEPLDSSFTGGSSIGFHEKPAKFTAGFYGDGAEFLNLDFEEGIAQAQVITITAGENININIDTDGNPGSGGNGSNGDVSFIAGGRLVNGNSIRLKNKKIKKSKLKLVNLNPGSKLNIKVSTDFPELINFAGPDDTYSFKKRSKKVRVKLAPYLDFIENPSFEELIDFSQVSVPVTIEDLDSGFTRTETIILE